MLKEHSDRVCTIFAVDYEPQIGYATKLSAAVEAVQTRIAAPHWASGNSAYLLRVPDKRLLLNLDFRRMFYQTLGYVDWHGNSEEYASVLKLALEEMGVKDLKRIGFRACAFLLLGMTHKEMCDLFPTSFLPPAEELESVCGKLDDALVQLHGNFKNMKLQVVVAPMTRDQAEQQFKATPNLPQFLEPKYFDSGVKEFKDRLASDCLFVDVDLSRKDVTSADIALFAKDSLEGVARICQNVVLRLKSLQTRKR